MRKSTLLDLPSGGTIDLSNFVAILPIEQSNNHQLLFARLRQPLTIDSLHERLRQRNDAIAIETFLSTQQKDLNSSVDRSYGSIDLHKPNAVNAIEARIDRHQNMTDEEDRQSAEAFDRFKHPIDRDRPLGQKLYS